jgi:hypothetical protein
MAHGITPHAGGSTDLPDRSVGRSSTSKNLSRQMAALKKPSAPKGALQETFELLVFFLKARWLAQDIRQAPRLAPKGV